MMILDSGLLFRATLYIDRNGVIVLEILYDDEYADTMEWYNWKAVICVATR